MRLLKDSVIELKPAKFSVINIVHLIGVFYLAKIAMSGYHPIKTKLTKY